MGSGLDTRRSPMHWHAVGSGIVTKRHPMHWHVCTNILKYRHKMLCYECLYVRKNYPENKKTVKFSLGETCSDAA